MKVDLINQPRTEVTLVEEALHVALINPEGFINVTVTEGVPGKDGQPGLQGQRGEPGEEGPVGPKGDDGPAGVGVPSGGSTGQVLGKASGDDYDTMWIDPPEGGGTTGVSTFNGRSGAVMPQAADYKVSDIEGLPEALADKASINHTHDYSTLTGRPVLGTAAGQDASTFAPAAHTHTIAQVTNLQPALDGKQPISGALSALSPLTPAADVLPYFTGSTAATTTALTAFGRSLIDDATATAARSTLGLGSASTTDSSAYAPAAHVGSGGSAHAAATTAPAGFMSAADKNKLDAVALGATANASDAQLRDRSTHTGTQPVSTVTGLSPVAVTGAYSDLTGTPAPYVLPTASASQLGGVKVGSGLSITDGVLAATGGTGSNVTNYYSTIGAAQTFVPSSNAASQIFVLSGPGPVRFVKLNGLELETSEWSQSGSSLTVSPQAQLMTSDKVQVYQIENAIDGGNPVVESLTFKQTTARSPGTNQGVLWVANGPLTQNGQPITKGDQVYTSNRDGDQKTIIIVQEENA